MSRLISLFAYLSSAALLSTAQVAIIDSGSTNSPGMTVTMARAGHQATIEARGGKKQRIKLAKEICDRMLRDLKTAGPLNELPVQHCMKSASFGSSMYIEYNGVRSGDLSCPQSDPRAAALQKDANEIMKTTRKYARTAAI